MSMRFVAAIGAALFALGPVPGQCQVVLAALVLAESTPSVSVSFADLDDFMSKHRSAMGTDIDEQPVFLAKSAWEIGYVADRFPKLGFLKTKERG